MDLIENKNINIKRHPWELSRLECLIKEIKQYSIGKDILDIGCGDTFFDYKLMEEKKDINKFFGIDIFSETEFKDGKYILINDYKKLKNKKFDTILMFDVLEHIENDRDFLKTTVFPLLKENGIVIMTVPAYQFLFSKHDKELKHYRRYNIKRIKESIRDTKFRVVKYHYFYMSLIPLRIISKLLNRDNKVNEWKKEENHIITKFFKNMLNLDYLICKKMNKLSCGLSLFIVLEKK